MRRSFFNEPIFEPGDDFAAGWMDRYMDEPEAPIARFIDQDEDTDLFGCEIADNNDREGRAEGFPTEQALRDWLKHHEIDIED